MFDVPTTLVLGAGASAPYGYPLGNELKRRIIRLAKNNATKDSDWVNLFDYNVEEIREFADKLKRSRQPSIDSFLSKQPRFAEIGKLAIVDIISSCEYEELLTNPESLPKSKNMDQNDDWYGYFIQNLYQGNDVDKIHENIRIISYNYDRSLEALLLDPLMNSYEELETVEDCASILSKIPIIHMYDRLDPLPWEGGNYRPYGMKCPITKIEKISKNINLIHESDKLGIIDIANMFIGKAERVYFLGMDLFRNRANIEILNPIVLKRKKIIATAFDLEPGEIKPIKSYFEEIQAEGNLTIPNMNQNITISDSKTLKCIKKHNPF